MTTASSSPIRPSSAFISRRNTEEDFDAHLTDEQKAIGWCVEKMCEEHLYWIIARTRWMDDANFERGPARFFDRVPAIVRPLVKKFIRRKIAKSLWAQGMGRHSAAEIDALGMRDIEALSTLIGDKPYLFGDKPCGADATVFAFAASALSPMAELAIRDAALAKPNLVAYRDRMMQTVFSGARKRVMGGPQAVMAGLGPAIHAETGIAQTNFQDAADLALIFDAAARGCPRQARA